MILYLDTSSLVKLYLDEAHCDAVRGWVDDAELVATCRVALPEAVSAFTRRRSKGELSEVDYERATRALLDDWSTYAALDFDEGVAAELVRRHTLRGFDAIHLCSVKLLAGTSGAATTLFSSFDERLTAAARKEGLTTLSLPER